MIKNKLFEFIVQLQKKLLKKEYKLSQFKQCQGREQQKFFLELIEMIDAFDNLNLRINDLQDQFDARALKYFKSYQRIGKKIERTLNEYGVKSISLTDKQAKIGLCEVIDTQKSSQHKEGEVISILKKGYQYEERLLRPMQVITCRN